ncbi:ABC transporter ATP-binding protein [Pseudochelatococcus sp. B33]
MAISLANVSRRFDAVLALNDVSLNVEDGAFLALLGPSGCGKTTLLRLVAGFEKVSAGTVFLNGRQVAGPDLHVPPEERQVAMVFQSYALWPHMSVAENVAFPLSVARVPGPQAEQRLSQALEAVGLSHLSQRRPDALSGGQRQRVALARALVQDARIVLCDEPLANLDIHLRAAMLDEFRRLHRETGRTFVYVTHDQAEALALASQVAVLNSGVLSQIASPQAIYAEPANIEVAQFVGDGVIIDAMAEGPASDGRATVRIAGEQIRVRALPRAISGALPAPVSVLVRPEAVTPGGSLAARVTGATYRGPVHAVTAVLDDGQSLQFHLPHAPAIGETVPVAITDGWVIPA